MPGTPSKERCTVARTNPSMYLKSILGALLSRTLKISLVCSFACLYKYIYFLIKNREQTQASNYVNGVIFMTTAIYLAINGSVLKLTV